MSLQIVAVHVDGSVREHLAVRAYRWRHIETDQQGVNDAATLRAWVKLGAGGGAWVCHGDRLVPVQVVRPVSTAPYLQAHADGVPVDALLRLPLF